jgi:hypothetical protein
MIVSGAKSQVNEEEDFLNVFHSISSHDLLDIVTALSSDKYNGRLSGSAEYLQTAELVADSLKAWGLKPYGDNGTYFQYFDSPHTEVKDAGLLQIEILDKKGLPFTKTYKSPDDYYIGSNTGSGRVEAEIVFAGYGITAPELNYDDYRNIDVKGKIVMIETELPVTPDIEDFEKWVPYSLHQEKLNNAVRHGAIGMLYVNHIANPNTSYNEGFVYCHISREVAQDALYNTGQNYADILGKIKNNLKPQSFNTGNMAVISATSIHYPESKGCNIIGIIEGSDPVLKDEVIILCAHLDGVGNLGSVLPGAVDNASGVAEIMTAGKAIAASPVKPKRTVMILVFGGEETNLLGSRYYCENPKFSIAKTTAVFNIEMAGNGTGLLVSGTLSYPEIHKCFVDANNNYIHRPLTGSESRKPGLSRPRRDSVITSRAGFRTFEFGVTGTKGTYYHHPLDNTETLTPEIMEDLSKMIFIGVISMANTVNLGL